MGIPLGSSRSAALVRVVAHPAGIADGVQGAIGLDVRGRAQRFSMHRNSSGSRSVFLAASRSAFASEARARFAACSASRAMLSRRSASRAAWRSTRSASRALSRSRFPASRTRRAGIARQRDRQAAFTDGVALDARPMEADPATAFGDRLGLPGLALVRARGGRWTFFRDRDRPSGTGTWRSDGTACDRCAMAAVSRTLARRRTRTGERRAMHDALLRQRWRARASRASPHCLGSRKAAASRARSGARCRR